MAVGGILARNTDNTVTQTGPGTAGQFLVSNGPGAVPTFQTASVSAVDYVVLSNGVQPPTPVDDGAGNFLYVGYTP